MRAKTMRVRVDRRTLRFLGACLLLACSPSKERVFAAAVAGAAGASASAGQTGDGRGVAGNVFDRDGATQGGLGGTGGAAALGSVAGKGAAPAEGGVAGTGGAAALGGVAGEGAAPAEGGVGGEAGTPTEGGAGGADAAPAEGGAGGEGGISSPPNLCAPNEPVCDGSRATTCNENGTGYLVGGQECSSTQTCAAGSCEDHECTPSTTFCLGNSVRACADNGLSSEEVTACGQGQYCDSAVATCKDGVCAPDQPACDGDRAATCNSTGSGYRAGGTTCAQDESCEAGECLPHVCTPNETFCQGQDVKTCAASGLSSTIAITCGASKTCVESGSTAACTGVCGPGQTQCSGNTVQSCTPVGEWETAVNCQASAYCTSGACTACSGNTANCDGSPNNACEVDLDSTSTCGTTCASILACSSQNGTASCTNGGCGIDCSADYRDCGGTNDGCETDIATDADNCNGCGQPCSSNHMATRTCGGRSCNGACASGYSDCDGDKRTNGCEQHTEADPSHCGDCTTVCKYRSCQGEQCVSSTWGNNQVTSGPTTTKLAKNKLWAMPVNVVPSGVSSTLLQALGIVVVVNGANPSANIRMGLYAESGGNAPNNLEAQTTGFATADGVSEQLLSTPVSISTGAHWVAFVADQDVRVHADSATISWASATLTYADITTLPATFPLLTPATTERGHLYAVTTP